MTVPDQDLNSWYRGNLPPGQVTPLQLVMIQSTTFCNLDCSYCYLPLRDKKHRFDLDLIPVLVERLDQAGLLDRHITIAWHAGEPLVMPVQYYRDAAHRFAEVCDPLGITAHHNFQSNGLLVSDEYVEFFKEVGAHIGISIDGPQYIHDARRTTRDGRGTFERAMAGFEKLRAGGLRPSSIAVLTEKSLDHADELYDFFKGLDVLEAGFNVEEIEGENEESTLDSAEMETKVREFYRQIYRRVSRDPKPLRVREMVAGQGAALAVFGEGMAGNSESNPLSIISIGHDGRVSSFSPELLQMPGDPDAYTFGNIETLDFRTLWQNNRFVDINSQIEQGIAKCAAECRYFQACGGGAPANKLAENGTFASSETMHCRLTKQALTDVMEDAAIAKLEARRRERKRVDEVTGASPAIPNVAPTQSNARPPRVIDRKSDKASQSAGPVRKPTTFSELLGLADPAVDGKASPTPAPSWSNSSQLAFPHLGAINIYAPSDRISLNTGTEPASEAATFAAGARVPKQDWRAITSAEHMALTSASRSPAKLNFAALVTLPDNIASRAMAIGEELLLESENGPIDSSQAEQLGRALIEHFDAGHEAKMLGVLLQRGGARTSTLNDKTKKSLGLHVDSWVSTDTLGRERSPNRIMVNLGNRPRHLLLLDLGVDQIVTLTKQSEGDRNEERNPTEIAREFMVRHPDYPVVRIEVRPGEAYIAATENLVHDGATEAAERDVALAILGRFSRSVALENVL